MKITDLQIGMKVKAIDNRYICTSKKYEQVGIVTYIGKKTKHFNAKTLITYDPETKKNELFFALDPEHFEPVEEEKKITTINEIPLKVTRNRDTIYIIYNGKTVAKITCSKDDTYDEEFGLNLALRRFCKTLNNSHEVVITRKKIKNVENYL